MRGEAEIKEGGEKMEERSAGKGHLRTREHYSEAGNSLR